MGENGPAVRPSQESAQTAALAAILDPLALEERLKLARASRAEAIARRPAPSIPSRADVDDAPGLRGRTPEDEIEADPPPPPARFAATTDARRDPLDPRAAGSWPSDGQPDAALRPDDAPSREALAPGSFATATAWAAPDHPAPPDPPSGARPRRPRAAWTALAVAFTAGIGVALITPTLLSPAAGPVPSSTAAPAPAPVDVVAGDPSPPAPFRTAAGAAPPTATSTLAAVSSAAPELAAVSAAAPAAADVSAISPPLPDAPSLIASLADPRPAATAPPAAPISAPTPAAAGASADPSPAAPANVPAPAAAPSPSADPAATPAIPAGPVAEPRLFVPAHRPLPRPQPAQATSPAPVLPGADGAQVFVHAPSGVPETEVTAALAGLRAQGVTVAAPISIDFAISRSHARYYHAEDAGRAGVIAAALPAAEGPAEARDFTDHAPLPDPGTVEVWIAGAPEPGARRGGARRPTTPAHRPPATPPSDVLEAAARDLARGARRLESGLETAARRLERALGKALD